MFNWYKQISVAARLKWLVAMSVSAVLTIAVSLLWTLYQRQMADRQQAVRQTVDVAHSLVQWYAQLAQSGQISQADGQRQALAALDHLRYNEREYFWVNDMDARMVHHPIKPALDGQDVGDMKDPNGVPLFREFVQTVRTQGAGFVAYQWPKPGHDAPVDKISYVKGFAPWGWVIGSGLYVDDIKSSFISQATQVGLGVLCCVVLLAGLAQRTARRVTRGIDRAVTMAEAIASGDIRASSGQSRPHRYDELGRLMMAMDSMARDLHDTVSCVRDSVDSVALASQQIAAGNQDLSYRTEQAAASLQHTASSMDELSNTVSLNAKSSSSAQDMATEASQQAARGGHVVQEVVRTLAQRSAQAAREIKTLIQASTEQVESGSQLVQSAGLTMEAIVESVDRVASLIHEIADATHEQSKGVGTMHGAVTQLDQMTQQNAALVEESAAAAGSLKDQALSLAEVVGRFKLGGGSALAA